MSKVRRTGKANKTMDRDRDTIKDPDSPQIANDQGVVSSGLLDAKSLAEELHVAGLNAYQGYEYMGQSADKWNDFRCNLAKNLLDRIKAMPKDRI